MQKTIVIFVSAILLFVLVLGLRFIFGGPEDTWLCQGGQWVRHGNPSAPMPKISCGSTGQQNNQQLIIITSPHPNQTIKSPLLIEGQARGTWFFEASFPIKLLDSNGNILTSGIAQANPPAGGDWMTENFVPFKGELNFQVATTTAAVLVLEKDNPSGLSAYDEKIEIPLILEPSETTKIKVYFNNNRLDPEITCVKVFPVEREIPKTEAIGRAALEELLKGPTEQEKSEGFLTNINPGVKIQSLTIDPPTGGGVAKVDFNEQLEFQVGGSCRVAAISAEITQTLKQFPTVKSVIISINGRTEDILQP